MIDAVEQLKYISDKLSFLSSKVERDNSQGLYNINKVSENIFLHLLNCSFDYNLEDANRILHSDFPAIDLIDHSNKLVVQVTSTLTTQKIYNSISKLKGLEDISSYKLKMCYISRKPEFSKQQLKNIQEKELLESDLIGIDDILTEANSDIHKRKAIYNTLLQRLDSKAFNLDIEDHFNKFESQLNDKTTKKFYAYNNDFETFIKSDANVLEVFAIGGNGKSHLLKHFSSLESEYTPVLFTKQTNVEADLKHLDITEHYLFIYDDIDRFLDTSINSIFSFVINSGSKIIISYRAASKPLIEDKVSRFNSLKTQELYITWTQEEIKDLILLIEPKATEQGIKNINAQFNSNPYLITQALHGGIDEIKNFSKKTLTDATIALQKFDIKKVEIEELLYRVALLSPCPKKLIDENDKCKVDELIKVGILRELNNKIRFNPDVLGDLYLASFVKNYENKYKEIILEYIKEHLELVITNLSYVLAYEENNGLELFFKDVIKDWLKNKNYKSSNLKILYRIVNFAPFESFRYLAKVTDQLTAQENEYRKGGLMSELLPQVCEVDFNKSNEHINLGSIVPIIHNLIISLKHEKDLGKLNIKHIIDFLISKKVLSLPEPYFVNHNLTSVFKDMTIPYEHRNNDVVVVVLEEMHQWLKDPLLESKKLNIIKSVLSNLLEGSVEYITPHGNKKYEFDTSRENIRKILKKAKEIVIFMLESQTINLKCTALEIFNHIGNAFDKIESLNELYYYQMILKILKILTKELLFCDDFRFQSKLDDVLLRAMAHRTYKDDAYKLFILIPRTPVFIFNQLLIGLTFNVYNLDEFKEEYSKQEDIKKWIFDKHYNKYDMNISENDKCLYDKLIKKYQTVEGFIDFVNSLYFIENYRSYIFTNLLTYWHEMVPQLFYELTNEGILRITNHDARDIIEKFILTSNLKTIDADSINESLELDELKKYVDVSFNCRDMLAYDKLFMIFKNENKENLSWFVETSFFNMYRVISTNDDYIMYIPIIHKLLDLVIQYRLTPSIYLIFILENLEEKNIPFENIKNKLKKVVYIPYIQEDLEEINIDEHNLKKIFNILGYTLEDILARVFFKILKSARFIRYLDNHQIQECYLIKDYIKDYTDYKQFVNLVINDYYNNFTYTHIDDHGVSTDYKIDINYFFSGLRKEYFNRYIQELIKSDNKPDLIVITQAIPGKVKYKELLVEVLNFLEGTINDEEVIALLMKERIPVDVYVELLNENQTSNMGSFTTFSFLSEQISNQEEVLTYLFENLTNIDIVSVIEENLTELNVTKKIINEINLEQTIK